MKKFFIVGCPRSGTTMLQQALNRHSQIVIPPETKFFYYFYKRSRSRQLAHLKRLNDEFDLGVNLPVPPSRVRTPPEARRVYNQMAQLYCRRLGHNGVGCFGEKTPEHTGTLGYIREVFPDARILFMYRDGRDVAVSLTTVPWIRCNIYSAFLIWLYYYKILERANHNASFNVSFVRYEDLVSHPARELDRVLGSLGLPYETQVAEGHGNREGILQRELAWKHRALESITADRIGVFQRELEPIEVRRLERLGGRALRELGYELSTTGGCSLSLRFLTELSWGLMRTTLGLPLSCLANELVGSAKRLFLDSYGAKLTDVL